MLCACGCGETTPIRTRSRTASGWVKGEPMRFVPHHHLRMADNQGHGGRKLLTVEDGLRDGWFKQNTNGGLCMCGCGEPTALAKVTHRAVGTIKGQPMRYIPGHNRKRMPLTEEHKRRISESHIGREVSDTTRARMSASAKRRWARQREQGIPHPWAR